MKILRILHIKQESKKLHWARCLIARMAKIPVANRFRYTVKCIIDTAKLKAGDIVLLENGHLMKVLFVRRTNVYTLVTAEADSTPKSKFTAQPIYNVWKVL